MDPASGFTSSFAVTPPLACGFARGFRLRLGLRRDKPPSRAAVTSAGGGPIPEPSSLTPGHEAGSRLRRQWRETGQGRLDGREDRVDDVVAPVVAAVGREP